MEKNVGMKVYKYHNLISFLEYTVYCNLRCVCMVMKNLLTKLRKTFSDCL